MKKLDLLLLRSFIGPFLLTFLITLFIFVMQFLWLYVDNLIGFGLESILIAKLVFYFSASVVPLALPLAILLSTLMTFGNLAENKELGAFKSAGISLLRVMRPVLVVVFFLSIAAFLFSNYVLPVASLKSRTLIYDITQQKPTLNIKEGVFYSEIDNYTIRAERKDKDNKVLFNIMIYDHSEGMGNNRLLLARKAEMLSSGRDSTGDPKFLVMNLYDGHQYQSVKPKPGEKKKHSEYLRTNFAEFTKIFDLTQFKMKRTDEKFFKDHYKMLNLAQLKSQIDTLNRWNEKRFADINRNLNAYFVFLNEKFSLSGASDKINPHKLLTASKGGKTLLSFLPDQKKRDLIQRALTSSRNVKNFVHTAWRQTDNNKSYIIKHKIEWHKKFSLSIACLVLFFIGAPFGAIIKRGGFGLPFIFAIVFFVILHVLSILGEKLAEEEFIAPFTGVWLSTFFLGPLGLFFTFKARNDSGLLNLDWYYGSVERFLSTRIFSKIFR